MCVQTCKSNDGRFFVPDSFCYSALQTHFDQCQKSIEVQNPTTVMGNSTAYIFLFYCCTDVILFYSALQGENKLPPAGRMDVVFVSFNHILHRTIFQNRLVIYVIQTCKIHCTLRQCFLRGLPNSTGNGLEQWSHVFGGGGRTLTGGLTAAT